MRGGVLISALGGCASSRVSLGIKSNVATPLTKHDEQLAVRLSLVIAKDKKIGNHPEPTLAVSHSTPPLGSSYEKT